MSRRFLPVLGLVLLSFVLVSGCAGPAKLAQKSDEKLAEGDMWKAWSLATKALDKAPAHPEARQAAANAASVISEDWQRKIRARAGVDTEAAAEDALNFVQFRINAIPYTDVPVGPDWMEFENDLRLRVAASHYDAGEQALASGRPKAAYGQFTETTRFWPDYPDADNRAAVALEEGLTPTAIAPLRSNSGPRSLGSEVAASWRGDLVQNLPPGSYFTRLLPTEAIEQQLRVSDLGSLDRDDAVRYAREAGADRVVWGTVGEVDSDSGVRYYRDSVYRKVREKDAAGHTVTRWIEVPIEIIARIRTVNVDLEYEVIGTEGGVTLARRTAPQSMQARVIWTSYTPEAGPDTYALVTDQMRSGDPEYARKVEAKWISVVGEGTTLGQVLSAKTSKSRMSSGEAVGRFLAGAAFVLLEELPSTEELTFGALAGGWRSVHGTLVELDGVDDVDLSGTGISTR